MLFWSRNIFITNSLLGFVVWMLMWRIWVYEAIPRKKNMDYETHKWWKGEGAVIWLCRVFDSTPYAIRARLASQVFAPKLLPAAFPRYHPVRDSVRLLIGRYGAETIVVSDLIWKISVNFTFEGLNLLWRRNWIRHHISLNFLIECIYQYLHLMEKKRY